MLPYVTQQHLITVCRKLLSNYANLYMYNTFQRIAKVLQISGQYSDLKIKSGGSTLFKRQRSL